MIRARTLRARSGNEVTLPDAADVPALPPSQPSDRRRPGVASWVAAGEVAFHDSSAAHDGRGPLGRALEAHPALDEVQVVARRSRLLVRFRLRGASADRARAEAQQALTFALSELGCAALWVPGGLVVDEVPGADPR
jgi:hypothetical protein